MASSSESADEMEANIEEVSGTSEQSDSEIESASEEEEKVIGVSVSHTNNESAAYC